MRVCRPILAALILTFAGQVFAVPAPPTHIAALHRNGQTFITWQEAPGAATRYHVYRSSAVITSVAGLVPLGSADQNSSRDARGQAAEGGGAKYFAVVPLAPLPADTGLFVHTTIESGPAYYAVTSFDSTGENTVITLGANSLAVAVPESPGLPTPVLQRIVTVGSTSVEVYVHWTSNLDAPLYPAMANIPSVPFHFGLVRRGAVNSHPLLFRPHARGGHYMGVIGGTGNAEEWTLALDDEIADTTRNTHWFGYHEALVRDDGTLNPAPDTGTVYDYTLRRMDWTLDWALATLPVDSNRVYMYGGSMGAIGSLFYSLRRPERIAAVWGTVPKFDYSFLNDPNPANAFNPGGYERRMVSRLWGTVAADLPASNGYDAYDWLNAGTVAKLRTADDLPPMKFFNGRQDVVVGWAEKIHTYADFDTARQQAVFFFDQRSHGGGSVAWQPEQQAGAWLYQFRRDLSYPAFSRCTANNDPGDGHMTDGDSIGAINAHLNFSGILDLSGRWQVTLSRDDLQSLWGVVPAPESIYVDVTPRRLQQFQPVAGRSYFWENRRVADNAVVQSGAVTTDESGLITVPAVLVSGGGNVLAVFDSLQDLDPNAPPVYVYIVSHNEEPPGNPNYASSPAIYNYHRAGLVQFANMLHDEGVNYNFQSDWNFLRAVRLYDNGSPETSGKNVVRWLTEDLGFAADPHAHESIYNYAYVAMLMDSIGVPPSGVVGGFIAQPPQNALTEYFRDTLWATPDSDYFWNAEILWGGATAGHVNDDSIDVSGIWRPAGNADFLRHNPSAPLPHAGGYVSSYAGILDLLNRAQNGELNPVVMHTATWFHPQTRFVTAGYVDSIRALIQQLEPYTDAGLLRWVSIEGAVDIWQSDFASRGCVYSSELHEYLVLPPIALTASRAGGNILLRWRPEPCAASYNIYRATSPTFNGAELIGNTANDWLLTPADGPRYFYRVTAIGE